MIRSAKLGPWAFFVLTLLAASLGQAQQPAPSSTSAATAPDPIGLLLHGALQSMQEGKFDDALDKANEVLKISPRNVDAYGLRGAIFSQIKLWNDAEKEYETILTIDPANAVAKFDLAEIKFRLKYYDDAKPRFIDLEKDADLGDISCYKAFLCDLYGGHEDAAETDLKIFDLAGSKASYYFGHVAWALYHHNHEEGRTWLKSAVRIFSPEKINLYASSMEQLGYLPIPPPVTATPQEQPPP